VNRGGRDDYVDNFAMQGSSQWDSLRHIRFREFGYYGRTNKIKISMAKAS